MGGVAPATGRGTTDDAARETLADACVLLSRSALLLHPELHPAIPRPRLHVLRDARVLREGLKNESHPRTARGSHVIGGQTATPRAPPIA